MKNKIKKINRDKDFLTFASVCFFMTLVVILWFFNIKTKFKTINAHNKQDVEFQDIKQDFKEVMDDMRALSSIQIEKTTKTIDFNSEKNQ